MYLPWSIPLHCFAHISTVDKQSLNTVNKSYIQAESLNVTQPLVYAKVGEDFGSAVELAAVKIICYNKVKWEVQCMKKVFGWILMILGGFFCIVGIIVIPVYFTVGDMKWSERIFSVLYTLLSAVAMGCVWYCGRRLKNSSKKNKSLPGNQESSFGNSSDVYLEDITFIRAIKHSMLPDNVWHQYDILLDAKGYGWDTMKDWVDYMVEADLENISQVETGVLGTNKQNVTESYIAHGGKCKKTPELDTEQSMLSIAGISKIWKAPMKIVWINQTATLRLFTVEENILKMKKYAETMVRRSFGTENAMKLGKPAQAQQTPAKPAEKSKKVESSTQKLNLGSYSFTDAQRQKLMSLSKRGLPEKTDNIQAQLTLLDTLDAVMDTSIVRLKTDTFVNTPEGMSDEEKTKYFRNNAATLMFTVDRSLAALNVEHLIKKVESADFDQLLNAWTVLNYYSNVMKPNYSENIRNYRDYIHHTLLSRYGDSESNCLVPVKINGTAIYINSALIKQWLEKNFLSSQFELLGVMPLSEKEPIITLYEDEVKTREYRLQTENDEDFTGKYFHIGVRIGKQGNPAVLAAQIDGFVSDTQQDEKMTDKDIGYRMEAYFLTCCGETAKMRYEMIRGQDLPMKALKYVGYTIPSGVRLIGICPDCGKSFCFHGYCVYMGNCDAAYSDDGLDCCQISNPNISKDDWTYGEDGKTFRYYNSFACPHCGTPYIDYRKFPENKKYGVCGCVHLGRKMYTDKN